MIRRIYLRFLSTKFITKVVIILILCVFFCIHFELITPLLQDKCPQGEPAGILGLFGPKQGESPKYLINYTSPWTWACGEDGKCHRQLRTSQDPVTAMEGCWLTCGTYRTLWPHPRPPGGQITLGYDTLDFRLENLSLLRVETQSDTVRKLAEEAFQIFKQNIQKLHPKHLIKNDKGQGVIAVSLSIQSTQDKLTLLTNETYNLSIQEEPTGTLSASISGETFFGVRHGLETLSQLIVFDDIVNCLKILTEVKIIDGPAFPYRGLLIDTARNFIPIPALQRMVDGMAQNKLNVLHWHITDSNSFPLFCPSFPQMTNYGAHSKDEIYHPEEVKLFVRYALLRGVKVIPEIDAPAHAGNGWQWGNAENGFGQLALSVNEEPYNKKCLQPPCGQLNPVNPKVYDVLRGLYTDILAVFDPDMFHMGGDEVDYNSWNTKEILEFMKQHNITTEDRVLLRLYFQLRALAALKMASNTNTPGKAPTPILWTSDLTNALPVFNNSGINATEYIIQLWEGGPAQGAALKAILDLNFPVIVSNCNFVYLDWGSGPWIGRNDGTPYITWQVLYEFNFDLHGYNTTKRVFNSKLGEIPQVLGGEAPLWSEKVNEHTMDAKLWPRGAAFAERLWLNPRPTEMRLSLVTARLLRQNERMKQFGILVDTRQPKSCLLINGSCEGPAEVQVPPTTPTTTVPPSPAQIPQPTAAPPVQFVTNATTVAPGTPTQGTPAPETPKS